MLSRIARGLYSLGRNVERAHNIVRILEVNHKMNLERASVDETNVWVAISEAFECGFDQPQEADLYQHLVLSYTHPHALRHCISNARDEGRAARDHISEELWLHLNRTHLDLANLDFESILRTGRTDFNRRIEVFADAFYGLADDTLVQGESWAFLRIGRFIERASMVCRVLEIKRKSLALAPSSKGAPIEVHQWQSLLRSLSGYEPYRRAYDARILPSRVLDFVLKRVDYPRSLAGTIGQLAAALGQVSNDHAAQMELVGHVDRFLEELRLLDTEELIAGDGLETELRRLDRSRRTIEEGLERSYFTSLRPASPPVVASPGAILVPQ